MKSYSWKRSKHRVKCARGSIRTVRLSKGKLLRVCCPVGKWQPRKKRCKVGTRAYEVGTPL